MSGEAPVRAVVTDEGSIVENEPRAQALRGEGYGEFEEGKLLLDPLETLYLVYRGRIRAVGGDGKPLSFRDLMIRFSKSDEMLWVRFTVYHDLRSRGRRVSRGPRSNSLVYRDPGGRRIEVYVLEESRMTSLAEIIEYIESSTRNDRIPVLAIVDRHGDVTYYSINRFQLGDDGS